MGAAHYFSAALKYADGRATDLLLQKAMAVLETGDYYSVISDTGQILKSYPKHLEAYRLRGMAYFWLNDHDIAIQHFREGLKLDPEHKGCKEGHKLVKKIEKKKKKGDAAFEAQNYEEAIQHYIEAIAIEPDQGSRRRKKTANECSLIQCCNFRMRSSIRLGERYFHVNKDGGSNNKIKGENKVQQ